MRELAERNVFGGLGLGMGPGIKPDKVREKRQKRFDSEVFAAWIDVGYSMSPLDGNKINSAGDFSDAVDRFRIALAGALQIEPRAKHLEGSADINVLRITGTKNDGVEYIVQCASNKDPEEEGLVIIASELKYPDGLTITKVCKSDVYEDGAYVMSDVVVDAGDLRFSEDFMGHTDDQSKRNMHVALIKRCIDDLLYAVDL